MSLVLVLHNTRTNKTVDVFSLKHHQSHSLRNKSQIKIMEAYRQHVGYIILEKEREHLNKNPDSQHMQYMYEQKYQDFEDHMEKICSLRQQGFQFSFI